MMMMMMMMFSCHKGVQAGPISKRDENILKWNVDNHCDHRKLLWIILCLVVQLHITQLSVCLLIIIPDFDFNSWHRHFIRKKHPTSGPGLFLASRGDIAPYGSCQEMDVDPLRYTTCLWSNYILEGKENDANTHLYYGNIMKNKQLMWTLGCIRRLLIMHIYPYS